MYLFIKNGFLGEFYESVINLDISMLSDFDAELLSTWVTLTPGTIAFDTINFESKNGNSKKIIMIHSIVKDPENDIQKMISCIIDIRQTKIKAS
ncbi:Na+/H+ antiporter subunit E [Candidatus Nesciobacter abundans]|uniref:Na+/H+ antiporter subunit E n=1 Tax=Candidatus Nesciobacter abundans TaxID=2601668 RepID=UPI001FEB1C9F|nr:Na+/H+ antiporter subunit E [Candidatus Nesciobacter abundans]